MESARAPPHQEGENWQEREMEGRKEGKFFTKHSGRLSQDRSKSKSQLPHEPDFLHLEGSPFRIGFQERIDTVCPYTITHHSVVERRLRRTPPNDVFTALFETLGGRNGRQTKRNDRSLAARRHRGAGEGAGVIVQLYVQGSAVKCSDFECKFL